MESLLVDQSWLALPLAAIGTADINLAPGFWLPKAGFKLVWVAFAPADQAQVTLRQVAAQQQMQWLRGRWKHLGLAAQASGSASFHFVHGNQTAQPSHDAKAVCMQGKAKTGCAAISSTHSEHLEQNTAY